MTVGKIQRVALREVWKHEAHDFTVWLEANIDVLNDLLDLGLTSAEREQSVGAFNVDLVAEDEQGGTIIIENQLEKSDHDHLGKVLTYMTMMSARAAVWIVADARPEHVTAITWLNSEVASAKFYLIKVEAIRIGDSPPAPLLTLIVGPSDEGQVAGEKKKEIAERHSIRHRFWVQLLERAKPRTKLHSTIFPGEHAWIGTGSGMRGLGFNYAIWEHQAAAELYIDRGKGADTENKAIFDALLASKADIEREFMAPLEWERLDNRRASRIRYSLETGGWKDPEETWAQTQDLMIDAMIRLEKALRPRIESLKVQ
jgi:hypothetical protein